MGVGTSPAYVSGAVATGPAADASYPLLILGCSKDPKNDIASPAYAKVLVRINSQQLTIGVGYGALGGVIMGVINTGSVAKSLWPGVSTFYGEAYREWPIEFKDLFDEESSYQSV